MHHNAKPGIYISIKLLECTESAKPASIQKHFSGDGLRGACVWDGAGDCELLHRHFLCLL